MSHIVVMSAVKATYVQPFPSVLYHTYNHGWCQIHYYTKERKKRKRGRLRLYTYNNARPITQTIDELMPCKNRATSMSQNDLASMNITRKPTKAMRPRMKGVRRDSYLSESHEMGGVAKFS